MISISLWKSKKMENAIGFLKELQQELKAQKSVEKSKPRYWSIMDYVWEVTAPGHEDRIILFDMDTCERKDFKEYVEEIINGERKEEYPEEALEELINNYELELFEEVIEWIDEYVGDSKYYPIYEKEISYIVPGTIFFTEKEALDYLEANRKHYSSKAHIYEMTVTEASKMEYMLQILEMFNWDDLVK